MDLSKVTLGGEDIKSIFKGLLIAVSGAALVYAGEVVAKLNFGVYTALVVALAGVIVNIGRKLFDGQVS